MPKFTVTGTHFFYARCYLVITRKLKSTNPNLRSQPTPNKNKMKNLKSTNPNF
jgi:hypothetical protein